MKKLLLPFALYFSEVGYGQPWLDLAKFNYSYSPPSGLNEKKDSLSSHFFSINFTLPIELKKGGDAIIINPFFEHNQGKVSENRFHTISRGLMVGFLNKKIFRKWDLFTGFILRQNKEAEKRSEDNWQYGGIILTTWNKNQLTSLRFGVYYNREFFGNYIVPLVGIDWKIDAKNNLFGVLPGNLTLEHKLNERFYYGASFRALTNSYGQQTIDPCPGGDCSAKNYLRVDDNQLGMFADAYVFRRIVFTVETGYTILRRYRFGFKGKDNNDYNDIKTDNFYFRIGMAYRVRFR